MEEDSNMIFFKENVVLTDIEGTTTSIEFVKGVLFPYIRKNIHKFFLENDNEDEVRDCIEFIKMQNKKDLEKHVVNVVPIEKGENQVNSIINEMLRKMDLDLKSMDLKFLQGRMWRRGYYSGELKGHIFEDVPPALERWSKSKKKLFSYSSGSVEAQRLLFRFSTEGDILKSFTKQFDLEVGPKDNPRSYEYIADVINHPPSDILFLTDLIKEAEAAKSAGCNVVILERPDNVPIDMKFRTTYKFAKSFDQLIPS